MQREGPRPPLLGKVPGERRVGTQPLLLGQVRPGWYQFVIAHQSVLSYRGGQRKTIRRIAGVGVRAGVRLRVFGAFGRGSGRGAPRARPGQRRCALLKPRGVPVAPIRTLDEVYDCPQTEALGMVQKVDHPDVGPLQQVAFPVSFGGERPAVRTAPPTLGLHSRDVLAELGYDDADIDRLLSGSLDPPSRGAPRAAEWYES
ncbi:CoA transferase [Streptomyces sp. NBC_01381]|uniref:CoA transferase n=1 Tax=Streptomyces sp. NBC_01381 TaxID=2903845 RepID=UPI00225A8F12|nr:CoA transferase [Streptomyces sp. NBC_01381]MCX4669016.1 CoA transferase [Streptomyces sp. NBC_01381]